MPSSKGFCCFLIENLNVAAKWKLCLFVYSFACMRILPFGLCLYFVGMVWNKIQKCIFFLSSTEHQPAINNHQVYTALHTGCTVHAEYSRVYYWYSLRRNITIHQVYRFIESRIKMRQQWRQWRRKQETNEAGISSESGSCHWKQTQEEILSLANSVYFKSFLHTHRFCAMIRSGCHHTSCLKLNIGTNVFHCPKANQ